MAQHVPRVGRHRLTCERKEMYGSFHAASRAAHNINWSKSTISHAYACGVCGGFHVGTTLAGDDPLDNRPGRFDPEPDVLDDLDEVESRYGPIRVSW